VRFARSDCMAAAIRLAFLVEHYLVPSNAVHFVCTPLRQAQAAFCSFCREPHLRSLHQNVALFGFALSILQWECLAALVAVRL